MTKSNCNSASYARDRWKSTIKWRRRKRFFVLQTGCNSHQSNKQKIIHPKVINLFNSCVTYTQARVLNKGLKFTPISRRNNNKMEKDIHYFTRKLRLTEYFADEDDITFDEETQPLVKNKGTFPPTRNRNNTLDIVADYLKKSNF